MSTLTKLAGIAAAVAVSATSAFALETVETGVPASLQSSRSVEAANIGSVTTFTQKTPAAASLNPNVFDVKGGYESTLIADGVNGATPSSLSSARIYQN